MLAAQEVVAQVAGYFGFAIALSRTNTASTFSTIDHRIIVAAGINTNHSIAILTVERRPCSSERL